jgi:hypothetical protein
MMREMPPTPLGGDARQFAGDTCRKAETMRHRVPIGNPRALLT